MIKEQNFSKLILYYFSGTGNSKAIVNWIADEAFKINVSAEIINISEIKRVDIDEPPKNSIVGFVSPTHGFNLPPIMLHFIFRFPRSKGTKVFIVNSRAGMKRGKIFLPGLSGMAQHISAIILVLKGYEIAGMRPVDLPSNWISLHPGLKEDVVKSIFIKREEEVRQFGRRILSGGTNYKALFDLIQDLLLAPIAILYYLFARFVFAKSFIASSDCTKCGLCVKQCPVNAIKWVHKRPFWKYTCESCMHCMNNCPERAIETAHGFIFGIAILVDLVILSFIYSYFNPLDYLGEELPAIVVKFIELLISSTIFIVFLLLFYRIMHWLLRYSFFERIIVYSSLTKYKFWRRYKPFKQNN